jgi:predicted permease
MASRAASTLRALLGRRRFEDGMAEEMRLHLDLYTADLVSSGMPPDEAARQARKEFGHPDLIQEDCRQARGVLLFDELYQDLRHAFRGLRRTPGFTVTALATLALCLGANLTIFAAVDSVLLRPLPFPDAGRLVSVYNTYPKAGVSNDGCSLPNYYERRGHIAAFQGLAAYREGTTIAGPTGATERVPILGVSADFFSTLGTGLAMGRSFTEAETTRGTDDVVILADAYWRQRLGGDPAALGRKIRLNGFEKTVVGVLPATFSFLSSEARLVIPLSSDSWEREPRQRHAGTARMIARLKPEAPLAEAQAEIDAHNDLVNAGDPQGKAMADAGFRSLVVPLRADHVAAIRPVLLLTQGGALFLLLIGAVNLMSLLLVRASGRARELAVRRAIGAQQRHVASAVLVETLLLALGGGLLGLALGAAGVRLLARLGADRLPLGAHIAFDGRLAAAALGAALLFGLAMGAPLVAYNLRGRSVDGLLFEGRGGTAGRALQRLRHGLVVTQIALAFVLLAGAGLLGLSLRKVMAVAPGFRPENVLSGQITLPGKGYPDGPALAAFAGRLAAELGHQPGVLAVGIATNVPLSGISNKSAATVEGYKLRPGESPHGVYSYSVDGDYFRALGLPLREGRFLTADDSRRPERVCVVDEDFARRYFPGGNALGRRLFEGSEPGKGSDAFTIVGVVGVARQAGLIEDAGQGAVYYPFGHRLDRGLFVVLRTRRAPDSLRSTLQKVVRGIDPELPVNDLRSMEARIADSLVSRRSPALLAALFAGIALLLTAIGTYGILSYAVAQRRREIGLRIALGARPEQVRGQFLALALRLIVAGTLLGVLGALLAGRAMQAVLFEVSPLPASLLAATVAVLGTVALAACLQPVERAARTSPTEAMTEE